MMYPIATAGLAGALASLAAGIATHGAIVNSMASKQARERAERADQVLGPYRPVLADFTKERLFAALKASHADWPECAETEQASTWRVEFEPAFLLTQDETNVIALLAFKAWPAGMASGRRPRETVIQIVSAALGKFEFKERWMDDDGALLTEKGAALVSDGLEIALQWEAREASTAAGTVPFRTYRYALGQNEHMERAQRISGTCDRAILRTLRSQYLSVPVEAPTCGPADPIGAARLSEAATPSADH